MKRFHMKKDQSGAALCTASEKACPNGAFGHYDSEYEVLMAYEQAITTGEVPGLSTMANLKREEIKHSRKELVKDLAAVKDEASYVDAIAFNLHPLDTAKQKELLAAHSDESFRSVAVRARLAKLTNSKTVLDSLSESETSDVVLNAVAENPQLTQAGAELLLSRFQGERRAQLKRFVAHGEVKLLEEKPTPSVTKLPEVRRREKSSEGSTPRAVETTTVETIPERPVKAIAQDLITAYADFNKNFTALDNGFSTMRNFVEKSGSFSAELKKELKDVLASKREYGRALHLGGVGGKPALDRASMSFERSPSPRAQRVIRKLVENQLRRGGLGYGVAFEGDKLIFTPVPFDELQKLYDANRGG